MSEAKQSLGQVLFEEKDEAKRFTRRGAIQLKAKFA